MVSTGNCRLEPMSLNRILDNPVLKVSIQKSDVQHCLTGIQKYGLLNPIVLNRDQESKYTVVAGACELEALRQLKVKQTDAVIVSGLAPGQVSQLSLHLLSLRSSKDTMTEAFLIQKLLSDKTISQADVAKMAGRSVSWVSKRAMIAERLNFSVQKMVIEKQLSARTAQEIAKLPPNSQYDFATRVIAESLPKSTVERLVATYNHADTTLTVKEQILTSPKDSLVYCLPRSKKMPELNFKQEQLKRKRDLYKCLDVLLRLTTELETLWDDTTLITEPVKASLQEATARLLYLQAPLTLLAPGQTTEGEYYAN